MRQLEITHVGLEEAPARMLESGDAHERWIDVEAVHDETVGRQKPDVLAGPTSNIEDVIAYIRVPVLACALPE